MVNIYKFLCLIIIYVNLWINRNISDWLFVGMILEIFFFMYVIVCKCVILKSLKLKDY